MRIRPATLPRVGNDISPPPCPRNYAAAFDSVHGCPKLHGPENIEIRKALLNCSFIFADKLKSTTAKANLTGDENVDGATGNISDAVGSQFGKGGAGEDAGKLTSDQVLTRSERKGKGESGGVF